MPILRIYNAKCGTCPWAGKLHVGDVRWGGEWNCPSCGNRVQEAKLAWPSSMLPDSRDDDFHHDSLQERSSEQRPEDRSEPFGDATQPKVNEPDPAPLDGKAVFLLGLIVYAAYRAIAAWLS